jgi:hypothetical protein
MQGRVGDALIGNRIVAVVAVQLLGKPVRQAKRFERSAIGRGWAERQAIERYSV